MKRSTLILLIAGMTISVAACSPDVTVQNSDGTTPAGISVSGRGEVTGTPDTLTITLGVQVRRDSVDEAVAIAADRADAIIAALMSNGVAEEDIQTANYSIRPEYDWSDDRQRLIGYQVTNSVISKIRDLERAGETIDAATAAGGNEVTVNGVAFSIEDNDALIEAARQAAWEDARSKADQLAELAGVELGTPMSINETFTPAPTPFRYEEVFAADDAGGATTPILPGEQAVTVSVAVQFSINS